MKVEEYRKLKKKTRTSFDGHANIRERLKRLNIVFEEEFVFAKPRKFRADFYIPEGYPYGVRGILIEYQGGTYAKTRLGHNSASGVEKDAEKLNLAQIHGYKLFQITANMLRDGSYFEELMLRLCNDSVEITPQKISVRIGEKFFEKTPSGKNWKSGKSR